MEERRNEKKGRKEGRKKGRSDVKGREVTMTETVKRRVNMQAALDAAPICRS